MSSGYPSNWDQIRKAVYQRDGYQCQSCGAVGGPRGNTELHAHHITPKSEGGSDHPRNLVTLCHSCHNKMHDHHVPSQEQLSATDSSGGETTSKHERKKKRAKKRGWGIGLATLFGMTVIVDGLFPYGSLIGGLSMVITIATAVGVGQGTYTMYSPDSDEPPLSQALAAFFGTLMTLVVLVIIGLTFSAVG